MEGNIGTFVGFFSNWWYKEQFPRLLRYEKKYFAYLADYFSVMACLNTLFYPWKRDQVSYRGLALKERFEAFLMNQTSKLIGAIVKLFTIAVFLISTAICAVLSLLAIVFWYFFPAVLIGLVILIIINVRP